MGPLQKLLSNRRHVPQEARKRRWFFFQNRGAQQQEQETSSSLSWTTYTAIIFGPAPNDDELLYPAVITVAVIAISLLLLYFVRQRNKREKKNRRKRSPSTAAADAQRRRRRPAGFDELCDKLRANDKDVTNVFTVLDNNNNNEMIEILGQAIEHNTNVTSLDLYLLQQQGRHRRLGNTCDDDDDDDDSLLLFNYIRRSPQLTTVTLEQADENRAVIDVDEQDDCFAATTTNFTGQFLQAIAANTAIRAIVLIKLTVTVESLASLVRRTKVKSLTIDNCRIIATTTTTESSSSNNNGASSITRVSSSSSSAPPAALVLLLSNAFYHNTTIKKLTLYCIQPLYFLVPILDQLAHHPCLENLTVQLGGGGSRKADDDNDAFGTTDAIQQIVTSDRHKLKVLSLSGFCFDSDLLEPLADCIGASSSSSSSSSCFIKVLRLEHCRFDSDATFLFEMMLQSNNTVERLCLGQGIEFDGGIVISTILHRNKTLRHLDLANMNPNLVSLTEFSLLMKGLERVGDSNSNNNMSMLESVSYGCIVDKEHCCALINSLPKMPRLKSLSLTLGRDLSAMKEDILRAFQENSSLQDCRILAPFLDQYDQQRIHFYTERNKKNMSRRHSTDYY